jgi:hypothetical protein
MKVPKTARGSFASILSVVKISLRSLLAANDNYPNLILGSRNA